MLALKRTTPVPIEGSNTVDLEETGKTRRIQLLVAKYKTMKSLLIRALGIPVAIALSASAFPSTFTFTGSANQGGVPQNGSATFTINPNDLVITLTNTGGPGQVQDIASELDGLDFTLTGGSAVLNAASLTGSDPGGAIDCAGVTVCTPVALASPFGWGLSGGPTFLLAAGNGSLHPGAIVNSNVVAPGGNGGVSNAQHNPLLLGPVTFTIGFTGTAPTGIGNVVLEFGTGPADVTGTLSSVPEPSQYGFLLVGLIGAGLALRRKTAAAQ